MTGDSTAGWARHISGDVNASFPHAAIRMALENLGDNLVIYLGGIPLTQDELGALLIAAETGQP